MAGERRQELLPREAGGADDGDRDLLRHTHATSTGIRQFLRLQPSPRCAKLRSLLLGDGDRNTRIHVTPPHLQQVDPLAPVLLPDEELLAKAQSRFGIQAFRPGQELTLRNVLEGRDTLAIMPTGGGKSLCYQLPALELPGT